MHRNVGQGNLLLPHTLKKWRDVGVSLSGYTSEWTYACWSVSRVKVQSLSMMSVCLLCGLACRQFSLANPLRLGFLTCSLYSRKSKFQKVVGKCFWGRPRFTVTLRICDCINEHSSCRLIAFLSSYPLVRTNETSIYWRRETSRRRRVWRTLMSTQTSKE